MKLPNKFTYKFLVSVAIIVAINSVSYAKESNVLSVVTGDWNQDNNLDAAVLMKNNDHVELYIFLANTSNKLQQSLYKQDIVWMGRMEGTKPYLQASKKTGSLLIHSENDSIGRNRWNQVLTVTYRSKNFMISGYTYTSYDTLNPNSSLSCDINLFTGTGFKNKKSLKITAQKIKLTNWTDDNIPKECISD